MTRRVDHKSREVNHTLFRDFPRLGYIKGLLRYIKGPSYFKHFLIGTFGGDSARARLSGASRYIYIIATGYESKGPPMGPVTTCPEAACG